MFIAYLLAFYVAAVAIFFFPLNKNEHNFLGGLNEKSSLRVLLLTAHPDDECYFFAPTILALTAPDNPYAPEVYSLCLSTGNADGIGELRTGELTRSLDILGIDRDKRWVVDHPSLQDNITVKWDADIIAETIKPIITQHGITTIITFDRYGVSSHPNHFSLPFGAAHLLSSLSASKSDSDPPLPRLFTLVTIPVIQKYSGFFSALLTRLHLYLRIGEQRLLTLFAPILSSTVQSTNPVFISSLSEYWLTTTAIQAHNSQLVWFRYLYMIFSRYMWVNDWVEVTITNTR